MYTKTINLIMKVVITVERDHTYDGWVH
jgi:hypothetical protein